MAILVKDGEAVELTNYIQIRAYKASGYAEKPTGKTKPEDDEKPAGKTKPEEKKEG